MGDASTNQSANDAVWGRVERQLTYYRTEAKKAKVSYRSVKLVQIVVGVVIPVLAAAGATGWITAAVAAIPIAAEGVQQLFQWQSNWLRFRSAAEALKTEIFLYQAEVEPYENANRLSVLAERTTKITREESAEWATFHQAETTSSSQPRQFAS
ncbi:DUF4231 domain-containing protein [Nocardia tengchongensis]|uniref:DUF4231 domain-containing protein n=1 Tax=Nocardia tengchongensis TaxID=2055889 RepID=UPI0036A97028